MSNINVMRKNLGPVTAYKYAVQQGYTGTEQEFAALMASYATVAEEAEAAKDDAIDAKTAAEAAQAAAEAAAEQAEGAIEVDDTLSVEGRAADAAATGKIKEEISSLIPIVADEVVSTNIFTPVSATVYPADGGACTIGEDQTINIIGLEKYKSAWIYAQGNEPITLEAGDYTLCVDQGLFVYGTNILALQSNASGSYQNVVSATSEQTQFTIDEDVTAKFRIAFYSQSNTPVTWSGHIWINKGDAQSFQPAGESTIIPKSFVETYQGASNKGKLLAIGEDGDVETVENTLPYAIIKDVYEHGNLIDFTEVAKGYIKADGTVQSYNTLWCSGFMPVEQGIIYCGSTVIYSQYFAFYDENKGFMASYSTLGAMTRLTPRIFYISVPIGAKYFRCSFTSDPTDSLTAWVSNKAENPFSLDSFNVNGVYPYTLNPENPCDYSELSVRAFSKVVCIGDSLTYGGFNMDNSSGTSGQTQSQAELSERYSYPSNFQRITGIETVNEGYSGETTVSWYSSHSDHDFSEYDLAIIHLGVNDSAFQVSDEDTITAMQNIVTLLNSARSDMRIAICSVIPAYDTAGYQRKGQLILNWAKSLNNPNIIPLDLAQYSHVRAYTSYVAGHLSAYGYYMMALDIARYISWYMDNNKRDFRFIQFIGSPDAIWSGD